MHDLAEEKGEGVNFFIPMVDLMVAVLFVFIIIIMVLVLLIKEEVEIVSAAAQTPVVNQTEELIANQSAIDVVTDVIIQKTLKRDGSDIKLNEQGVLRTIISAPDETRQLSQ